MSEERYVLLRQLDGPPAGRSLGLPAAFIRGNGAKLVLRGRPHRDAHAQRLTGRTACGIGIARPLHLARRDETPHACPGLVTTGRGGPSLRPGRDWSRRASALATVCVSPRLNELL